MLLINTTVWSLSRLSWRDPLLGELLTPEGSEKFHSDRVLDSPIITDVYQWWTDHSVIPVKHRSLSKWNFYEPSGVSSSLSNGSLQLRPDNELFSQANQENNLAAIWNWLWLVAHFHYLYDHLGVCLGKLVIISSELKWSVTQRTAYSGRFREIPLWQGPRLPNHHRCVSVMNGPQCDTGEAPVPVRVEFLWTFWSKQFCE